MKKFDVIKYFKPGDVFKIKDNVTVIIKDDGDVVVYDGDKESTILTSNNTFHGYGCICLNSDSVYVLPSGKESTIQVSW